MTAIQINNLTKIYRLYQSPKDRLRELVNLKGKKYHRDFHALNDVSLNVEKGETVGIIGQNGSGKSTLLKIICGVVKPTNGNVMVNGRISSLLELGAGFHPEFTGRDNVYMNGALTGLSREEMDRRFPQIEALAEIGEFIEQPVKTYSSGMFVRLAFAAAISVDPEILVVDEAFAVGDTQFQRTCMRKMHEFRSQNRTVLIVSHNLYTIRAFCTRCMLISHGRLVASGDPDDIVNRYLHDEWEKESVSVRIGDSGKESLSVGNGHVRITGAKLCDSKGKEVNAFKTGDNLILDVSYYAREKTVKPTFGYSIFTKGEQKIEQITRREHSGNVGPIRITSSSTKWDKCSPRYIEGRGVVRVSLSAIPLLPGHYSVWFAIRDEHDLVSYDLIEDLVSFQILEGDDKNGILGTCGILYYPTRWEALGTGDGKTNA